MIFEKIKKGLNLGNATIQFRTFGLLVCCLKIYRTIIVFIVLYGCETWSLTLREGHRLKVFGNRVLRRIFRPKRD
jgi:hypothetical protein